MRTVAKWTIGVIATSVITLILDILLRGPLTTALDSISENRSLLLFILATVLFILGLAALGWWLLDQFKKVVANDVIPTKRAFSRLEAELATSNDLLAIHDAFLVNLSQLWKYPNDDKSLEKLLRVLISECQKFLGETITRVYILLPDRDFLKPFVLEGIPEAEGYERKFYIGNERERKRGLAGAAYVNNEIVKDSFQGSENSYASADGFRHEEFIQLGRPDRPLQYKSVIAIPIRSLTDSEVVGVICLDSSSTTAFESSELEDFLMSIGSLVAMAMSYANDIRQMWNKEAIDRSQQHQ